MSDLSQNNITNEQLNQPFNNSLMRQEDHMEQRYDQTKAIQNTGIIKEHHQIIVDIDQKDLKRKRNKKCNYQHIEKICNVPSFQNQYLMFGDLLIKVRDDTTYDYNSFTNICNLFLEKKRIIFVNYEKVNNIIEVEYDNFKQGNTNFDLVKQILMNSQDYHNYNLAQQIDNYEYNSLEANIQYSRFFAENEERAVRKSQLSYFNNMRQQLLQNMKQTQSDFYTYVFYTYIDKNEMGFPIQKYQGISEAASSVFGFEVDQLIEIIQRHGFFENLIINCFSKILTEERALKQIMLMQYVEQLTSVQNIFDEMTSITTIDGIHVNLRLTIKQFTQKYNGVIISTFTCMNYQIDPNEIAKILQIRQTKQNYLSDLNIVDYIINSNQSRTDGLKFADFISNGDNFKPPYQQDLYPNKTCKYKQVNTD